MCRSLFGFGLLLLAVLAPLPAAGHPHAWIDLRSRVVLDERGQISALELYWLFDEWYTIYIANEFVESNAGSAEFLTELGRQNLSNLAEYDYFTEISLDDQPVPLGTVTSFDTGLQNERLWMRFQVPLARPIDPKAGQVAFRVYDPTYYIEVLHMEGEPVTFSGNGAVACVGRIVQPNPSFEAVTLAAALDRTETAGEGLGRMFAETVVIDCS
jgi:ABC-type uncharacterized transport system substrate-binding protein